MGKWFCWAFTLMTDQLQSISAFRLLTQKVARGTCFNVFEACAWKYYGCFLFVNKKTRMKEGDRGRRLVSGNGILNQRSPRGSSRDVSFGSRIRIRKSPRVPNRLFLHGHFLRKVHEVHLRQRGRFLTGTPDRPSLRRV